MSREIAVVTWLWTDPHAKQKFKPYHVERWAKMVSANLTLPHRLICITDQEFEIQGVERYPIWEAPKVSSRSWHKGRPQCYRRARIFDPEISKQFGEYIISMDLDLVVVRNLDPLFSSYPDFKIMKGGGNRNCYNGSMWMFKWDAKPQIWERFTPQAAEKASKMYMGSDQAWFRFVLGDRQPTWDSAQGAYQFAVVRGAQRNRHAAPANARIVFFAGPKKPWHVPIQRAYPWVRELYGDTPEFETKSQERVLDSNRQRDYRGRPTRNIRTVRALIKQDPPFKEIVPEKRQEVRVEAVSPADGGILWCFNDGGGWGFALYLEALKRGWDARLWRSASDVTDPGYVFFRVPQDYESLEKSKRHALDLYKKGNVLIPDIGIIEDYEDKAIQYVKYRDWMPATRIHYEPTLAKAHLKEGPYPMISKARTGSASNAVRILRTEADAAADMHTVFGPGFETATGEVQRSYLIWSEFLEGNKYAYRVTRIGSQHFAFRIWNREGTPLASGSGKLEPVDYTEREVSEVIRFAKDFFDEIGTKWCAVDVIRDHKWFKWRVLETSLAWTMSKPMSNPQCTFMETGLKVCFLFDTLCEEIRKGVFSP